MSKKTQKTEEVAENVHETAQIPSNQCPLCKGTGRDKPENTCPECQGTGVIK